MSLKRLLYMTTSHSRLSLHLWLGQSETTINRKNLSVEVFTTGNKDTSLGHVCFSTRSSSWNCHRWKLVFESTLVRLIVLAILSHLGWENSGSDSVDFTIRKGKAGQSNAKSSNQENVYSPLTLAVVLEVAS